MQVVPDPRPPATFRELACDRLGPARWPRSLRHTGEEHDPSLARLTRLARTAKDERLRQLAYRLERRLRYQDVAGGPVKGG